MALLRARLDPRHDPAVLADLPVEFEPELLVGRQRTVEEEAGGHGAGVLGVALDGSAAEAGFSSTAPVRAAVATPWLRCPLPDIAARDIGTLRALDLVQGGPRGAPLGRAGAPATRRRRAW